MRTSLKQWITDLERSALEYQASGPGTAGKAVCPLRAEPCDTHGGDCVAVVFGEVKQHFRWTATDPAQVARSVLNGVAAVTKA